MDGNRYEVYKAAEAIKTILESQAVLSDTMTIDNMADVFDATCTMVLDSDPIKSTLHVMGCMLMASAVGANSTSLNYLFAAIAKGEHGKKLAPLMAQRSTPVFSPESIGNIISYSWESPILEIEYNIISNAYRNIRDKSAENRDDNSGEDTLLQAAYLKEIMVTDISCQLKEKYGKTLDELLNSFTKRKPIKPQKD